MSNDTPLSPEAEKLSAARKRNLDLALTQIQKDFGENAIMRLGDNAKMEVDVIPTGNLLIDRALGVGGFARGRVVEIYGPESSGKTTLTLTAIAQAQKSGGLAAFIDVEHALDPTYAEAVGNWTMPDPIDPDGVMGIRIMVEGEAQSINMATLRYTSWELQGEAGKILLKGQSIGNGQTIDFTETATIAKDADGIYTLTIESNGAVYTKANE